MDDSESKIFVWCQMITTGGIEFVCCGDMTVELGEKKRKGD